MDETRPARGDRRKLVAIIDTSEGHRAAAADLLDALGFATCTFASAVDLLACPWLGEIRAILSETRLPGLSGLALVSALRARGLATPVIIMAAHPDSPIERRAVQLGAFGYLAKPVDPERLLALLAQALT